MHSSTPANERSSRASTSNLSFLPAAVKPYSREGSSTYAALRARLPAREEALYLIELYYLQYAWLCVPSFRCLLQLLRLAGLTPPDHSAPLSDTRSSPTPLSSRTLKPSTPPNDINHHLCQRTNGRPRPTPISSLFCLSHSPWEATTTPGGQHWTAARRQSTTRSALRRSSWLRTTRRWQVSSRSTSWPTIFCA